MLKKIIGTVVLSLVTTLSFADAAKNINVAHNLQGQFQITPTVWGYQFNNVSGKMMEFTLSVDAASPYAVDLQCWHKADPVEEFTVMPGQTSKVCLTNDAVRVVSISDEDSTASGNYTISVLEK